MIRSFACKDTESIFLGQSVPRFKNIQNVARRKLLMIDVALSLDKLRKVPGNRLEILRGTRAGQYSIRINIRWRICFCWQDVDAYDVEIVDYH